MSSASGDRAFAPRDGATFDYWFWKFHVDDLAVIVDVIVRRPAGSAEVRVSYWLGGVGRVIHARTTQWSTSPDRVTVDAVELAAGRSAGGAGDASWDLRWDGGGVLLAPLPAIVTRMNALDTTIVTWPLARFTGTFTVGDRRFAVSDVAGAFYHYWGRALAPRWVWLSASAFDGEPARRLEAIVAIRSRLFGGPIYPVTLGYLWSSDGDRSDTTVSTVNGLIRLREVPSGIEIRTTKLGGPRHLVRATWGSPLPNDIGDGIVQTMLGDAVIDGHAATAGTVGFESRAWPSQAAIAAMPANGR